MSIESTNDNNVNIADTSVRTVENYSPEHSPIVTNSPVDKSDSHEVKQPLRPLTKKEREYLRFLHAHPTATKRDAIRAVYDVKDGAALSTLDNMAGRIEKRPAVLAVLQEHAVEAEETLTEVMQVSRVFAKSGSKEGAMYATVAKNTADSILDRLYGRAKQSIDVTSKSVNINVDLMSSQDQ